MQNGEYQNEREMLAKLIGSTPEADAHARAFAAKEVTKLAERIAYLKDRRECEDERQEELERMERQDAESSLYELYEGRWCVFASAPDAGTWPLWLIAALAVVLIAAFIIRRARAEERQRAEMVAHLSNKLRSAEQREDEAAKRMAAALARAYGDERREWSAGVTARHESIVRRARARLGEPEPEQPKGDER
jgi:MYXO-CTERM domain-containing protein